MNELDQFFAPELRPLPIFVLADTSGSMKGEKLETLKQSIRTMYTCLKQADDVQAEFYVSIIGFRDTTARELLPLTSIQDENFQIPEMVADGKTPLGEALKMVCQKIEDRTIVSSRSYAPSILLISDGLPTDLPKEYEQKLTQWPPLQALLDVKNRSSKAQRFALAVGKDANRELLSKFINDPTGNNKVISAAEGDEARIVRFFNYATMSTISRVQSGRPDDVSIVVPFEEPTGTI